MACDNCILDGAMLRIYIDGEVIAKDTSSELSVENSSRETTSKTSGGWMRFVSGIKGWSVSGDALVISDQCVTVLGKKVSDIFAYLVAGTEVTMKLATPDMLDGYYEGKGIFNSLSISSGNSGENVTYSYGIQGTGNLEFKTI